MKGVIQVYTEQLNFGVSGRKFGTKVFRRVVKGFSRCKRLDYVQFLLVQCKVVAIFFCKTQSTGADSNLGLASAKKSR